MGSAQVCLGGLTVTSSISFKHSNPNSFSEIYCCHPDFVHDIPHSPKLINKRMNEAGGKVTYHRNTMTTGLPTSSSTLNQSCIAFLSFAILSKSKNL